METMLTALRKGNDSASFDAVSHSSGLATLHPLAYDRSSIAGFMGGRLPGPIPRWAARRLNFPEPDFLPASAQVRRSSAYCVQVNGATPRAVSYSKRGSTHAVVVAARSEPWRRGRSRIQHERGSPCHSAQPGRSCRRHWPGRKRSLQETRFEREGKGGRPPGFVKCQLRWCIIDSGVRSNFGAVRGTTIRRTCGPRAATGTSLATGTTTSGFVVLGMWSGRRASLPHAGAGAVTAASGVRSPLPDRAPDAAVRTAASNTKAPPGPVVAKAKLGRVLKQDRPKKIRAASPLREKGNKNQGNTSRAQRNPMSPYLSPGWYLRRHEARKYVEGRPTNRPEGRDISASRRTSRQPTPRHYPPDPLSRRA